MYRGERLKPLLGAISTVVARFLHTEEVTGSNPVLPISLKTNTGKAFAVLVARMHGM